MSGLISSCLLCEEHSLHVYGNEDAQIMQCVNCGYTSTSNFRGKMVENEEYKKLNGDMKKCVKETNDRFWIPTIMTLPTGMLYPVDIADEMQWAYAPMINIPEEEQENYPDGNGGFFKQRYDNDNRTVFNNFVDSMLFLTNIGKDKVDG